MTRQPVQSENLTSVGFDDETTAQTIAGNDERTGMLEVEFKGGRVYQYSHVPAALFEAMMDLSAKRAAGDREASVGRFFVKHVRNDYFCKRVDPS